MKNHFLTIITSLLVLIGGLLLVPAHIAMAREAAVPLWGPYLTGFSETRATINWKTETATWGVVQYATSESYDTTGEYRFSVPESSSELHHVKLSALNTDTLYRYRVWIMDDDVPYTSDFGELDSEALTEWLTSRGTPTEGHSFRTFGGQSFSFVVYGDTQSNLPWFTQLERHKVVAGRIAQEPDISFILHVGDLVADGDDQVEWDRFFEAGRAMLAEVPIYPVLGNHENNSPNYYDIFGVSEWYSFDCGGAHFAALDSNGGADFEAETEWLRDDLSSGADWKFAFYHQPAYTSEGRVWGGWTESRDYWESLFIDNGVNAVFSGHVHAYERYLEKGINYIVVGTGGGETSTLLADKPPGYQNSLENTLGYARVTVAQDSVTMRMVEVAEVSASNEAALAPYPDNTVFETVSLGQTAPPELPIGSFSVGPPVVSVSLPRDGRGQFSIYVTSRVNGELSVSTETLPFDITPKYIIVTDTDQNRKVDFEISNPEKLADGEYSGKLALLYDPGNHLAYGVKLKASVTLTQEAEAGSTSLSEPPENVQNGLDRVLSGIKRHYLMIIIAVSVALALVFGIRAWRRRALLG